MKPGACFDAGVPANNKKNRGELLNGLSMRSLVRSGWRRQINRVVLFLVRLLRSLPHRRISAGWSPVSGLR
jgi:hypothetical protein